MKRPESNAAVTGTIVSVLAVIWMASAGLAQDAATPPWAYIPDTVSPEWGTFILEKGKGREAQFPAPDDIEAWKKIQSANDQEKEPSADEKAKTFSVTYKELEIAGVPVIEVLPRKLASAEKIVVYTHGGAYTLNSAKAVIESPMLVASDTGLRVIAIDYTLAPHSKWQQTTDDVVSVFKALEEQGFTGSDILLYGDSAGGGLAAGATLKMRDLGMEMPAALVLWSPWADISETGDTYVSLRDAEVFFTYKGALGPSALAYADAKDHKNPYVSPVYGDFSKGFPPTLIQGGTKEIFLSNFIRLYQAIDQAGQVAKLDIYEGMPHVFPILLTETKEAKAAIAKFHDWVNVYLLGG